MPTEWSITAVDDIISKKINDIIRQYHVINNYYLFGHKVLGNNIQILLLPTIWMFEVLEVWLLSKFSIPDNDYEYWKGRNKYAENVGGAYYAAKLPILEYLYRIGRQGGAIVFIEIHTEWIPPGVWRIREICRIALKISNKI